MLGMWVWLKNSTPPPTPPRLCSRTNRPASNDWSQLQTRTRGVEQDLLHAQPEHFRLQCSNFVLHPSPRGRLQGAAGGGGAGGHASRHRRRGTQSSVGQVAGLGTADRSSKARRHVAPHPPSTGPSTDPTCLCAGRMQRRVALLAALLLLGWFLCKQARRRASRPPEPSNQAARVLEVRGQAHPTGALLRPPPKHTTPPSQKSAGARKNAPCLAAPSTRSPAQLHGMIGLGTLGRGVSSLRNGSRCSAEAGANPHAAPQRTSRRHQADQELPCVPVPPVRGRGVTCTA